MARIEVVIHSADPVNNRVLNKLVKPFNPGKLVMSSEGHGSLHVRNIVLPGRPSTSRFDISIDRGIITSINETMPDGPSELDPGDIDGKGGLCAPAFCHAHVHLDKAFILSDPKFEDLDIVKGDFAEAMELTGKAKQRFEHDDLIRRGQRLIDESVRYGVTSMRAFVELDEVVDTKCLDAAVELKRRNADKCDVQICAFAQLAIFTSDAAKTRRDLLERATKYAEVETIGSTPYVEADRGKAIENVKYVVELANQYKKSIDFHLDYNLDEGSTPLVGNVLEIIHEAHWMDSVPNGTIVLGHCTKLTHFRDDQWAALREQIGSLPVSFIGLPTSDLFMMGRPSDDGEEQRDRRPRGTLQILSMIERQKLNCAVSINNIGNAFTPQGSCNPLRLANLCVGVYQASTRDAIEVLYSTISTRARAAIGNHPPTFALAQSRLSTHQPLTGDWADLVIFASQDDDTTSYRARNIYEAVTLPDTAELQYRLHRGNVVT